MKQPVNVEPLAAAVFPDDIDLDLLGSGTVMAFRKGDQRLSYADTAVIYDFYAGDRSSKREGLIVLIVRRYDTRELAATLFDSHCARDKYATQEPVPVTITQFDGGRACVSDVQATSYNDAGSPDAYEAYLVVQKNTLVIELYQRSCDIPGSTLREDVAEFLAEHLPDLAQQLDRVASRPWQEPVLPGTPSRSGYAAPAVSYTSKNLSDGNRDR